MAKLAVADIPHMFKMWDPNLNSELPENVSVNCSDKKYWRCPDCGYDWSTSPKARYKGTGKCPCHESNKVIRKGINDILTIVKGLDAFLDEENDFNKIYNQGLDSSLPVNYICNECNRKWTASLKSQVKKDGKGGYIATGCPHYNTVKRKKSDVPFCSEVATIMKFWDDKNFLDPTKTKSISTEKVHFVCKNCGYDWTCEIRSQTRGTGKCKCCELQRVTKKDFTDVFTLIPDSKRYFDFDKNMDIDIYSIPLRDSETSIDWKCPDCNSEWTSPLASRIKGKKGAYSFIGCRNCYLHDKKRITPVSAIPHLLKYWDFEKNKDIDVYLTSAYSDDSVNWKCPKCRYEWITNIRSRMNSDGTCPFCKGIHKPVIKGINDVLTVCPQLSQIYDFDYNKKNGVDIYSEGVHSKTEAHFKCKKCGYEWNSAINNRVKRHKDGTYKLVDCPACNSKRFRKVPYSVEFPQLAKMYREDLNNISLDSIRGANAISYTYYHWDCPTCGETFESTLNAMKTSYKTLTKGCPYCARTKLRRGESFAELHPELMDEYNPNNIIAPYNVFANCKDSAGWICRECGYKWNATFALRHVGGGNCPICNRTILIPDINSFAAVYPEHAKYWADSNERKANEVFYNSSEWFRFICPTCNEEHGSYKDDFVSEEESCPYCKGTKTLPGFNSFAHNHPELLNELDEIANYLLPVTPDEVSDSSDRKFWWICSKNPKHKYPMSPHTRLMFQKRNREPCLYCRGQRRKLNHFVEFTS